MPLSFYRNKLVVVTGGAGFVGSHLVDGLLANGAEVVIVDNFLTGREENLQHLTKHPNMTVIRADVSTDPDDYLSEIEKIGAMFHLASPASPPRYQTFPVETYLANSLGTHLLLDYLKHNHPQARFIYASTSEVYGDPLEHPQAETYFGNVNPNGIRSCYDESKRLGEAICGVFQRDFGLNVRIVRIFNTYGPRMDPKDGRLIPNLVRQALAGQPLTIYSDGQQTRSFCYVSDLVAGLMLMGAVDEANGETVNLGNQGEFTALETAKIIQGIVNPDQKLELIFSEKVGDDPTRRKPDIKRAHALLDWQPTVELEEGLGMMLEKFKS